MHAPSRSFNASAVIVPKGRSFNVSAVIVPKGIYDLPSHSIPSNISWNHLSTLKYADPDFGPPGRIDLLLGVETCIEVM